MAYRKDLEKSAAMMSKIKAPFEYNGKISSKKFDRKLSKVDPSSIEKDIYFPLTGKHGEENRPKIAFGNPGSVTSVTSTTFIKGNKKYTKKHNSGSGVTSYIKEKIKNN